MGFTQDEWSPYLDMHERNAKDTERTKTMGSLLGQSLGEPHILGDPQIPEGNRASLGVKNKRQD